MELRGRAGETSVRGITETRVSHCGMEGVKERNRVKQGEKRGKRQTEDDMAMRQPTANPVSHLRG